MAGSNFLDVVGQTIRSINQASTSADTVGANVTTAIKRAIEPSSVDSVRITKSELKSILTTFNEFKTQTGFFADIAQARVVIDAGDRYPALNAAFNAVREGKSVDEAYEAMQKSIAAGAYVPSPPTGSWLKDLALRIRW